MGNKYVRVGLFGFLTWLIPFGVSVLIYPIHDSQRPLFESIMPVVVTLCAVGFAILYFRRVRVDFLREGVLTGVAWLAINILLDLLMFMQGPMKMPLADYMMDIGLTYLIIPTVTVGFGYLLGRGSEG